MRRKLYGNTISPACEVCAYGRRSSDGNAVLCSRKGGHASVSSLPPLRIRPSPADSDPPEGPRQVR